MIVSEPLQELVGGGKNAKHVTDCRELYLGGKGIEKIRGFEVFKNLEVLWLNNNKLKKINNLEANFKIKVLCAQDNQICTLRGSLLTFTFLEHLDLSGNQLRDLEKILAVLAKFSYLKHLNLKGNPCCEEPNYRQIVIQHLRQLEVLDQHVVTPAELQKATASVVVDGTLPRAVAFGVFAPPYDPKWDERPPEKLQGLGRAAATIRDIQYDTNAARERQLFGPDPYDHLPRRRSSLPPNAGTVRALQQWNQQAGTTKSPEPTSRHPPPIRTSPPRSQPSTTGTSSSSMGYKAKDVLVVYTHGSTAEQDEVSGSGRLSPTLSKGPTKLKQYV